VVGHEGPGAIRDGPGPGKARPRVNVLTILDAGHKPPRLFDMPPRCEYARRGHPHTVVLEHGREVVQDQRSLTVDSGKELSPPMVREIGEDGRGAINGLGDSQQGCEKLGVPLIVSVKEGDPLRTRQRNTPISRRADALVWSPVNLDPKILDLLQNSWTVVGGTIIDNDDFKGLGGLAKHRVEGAADVGPLLEDWDNDRRTRFSKGHHEFGGNVTATGVNRSARPQGVLCAGLSGPRDN